MLCVAFGCVVAMLNLEGLLTPPNSGSNLAEFRRSFAGRWFLIPSVAKLALPGALFDPDPVRGQRGAIRWTLANICSFIRKLV